MIRLSRGDLSRFRADAYLLPTKGGFGGQGVARLVLDALDERHPGMRERALEQFSQVAIGPGYAALVTHDSSDEPDVIALSVTDPDGLSRGPTIRAALGEGLRCVADHACTVAIPALGTGAGRCNPTEAAEAMLAVLAPWATDSGREVVVVVYQAGIYRSFLSVFESHLGMEATCYCADEEDDLDELEDCLFDPRSFLFVGSGLSFNADPPMPAWQNLLCESWFLPEQWKAFSDLTGREKGYYLPDFAQIAADVRGRELVEERFAHEVAFRAWPSLPHYQLLSLPWSAIVTTNYDTLIEDTLEALGLPCKVIATDAELADIADSHGIPVVKIHGGLGEGRAMRQLVATRDDYDGFFDTRPAVAAWLEALLFTARGVIVGYSISDPHLRHLFARIGRVSRVQSSRLFCISDQPTPITAYWKARGLRTVVVPLGQDDRDVAVNYRDFIDAMTNRAHRRAARPAVPPEHLDGRWEELLGGLDGPEQRATLVSALMQAGCDPPGDAQLLELLGSSGQSVDQLWDSMQSSVSPERWAWLSRWRHRR